MIQPLATNTNKCSVKKKKKKKGISVNTNTKEIQKVLAMYPRMGLVQMAGTLYVLGNRYTPPPVANLMSSNRFHSLLTLHFVNKF